MIVLKLLIYRLIRAMVLLWIVSLMIFTLIRLAPGDPVDYILGANDLAIGDTGTIELQKKQVRKNLGLDVTATQQYLNWIKRLALFDLGNSYRSGKSIVSELADRLPATLYLAGAAFLVQVSIALGFGIIASLNEDRWADHLIRLIGVLFVALPSFLLGLILLEIFAIRYPVYDMIGQVSFKRMWLPALTLGVLTSPPVMRLIRVNLIREYSRQYIVFGRSKGLGKKRLVGIHALGNGLLPILSVFGVNLAGLFSGSVIIESIFVLPGIGRYAVESIFARDYPAITGYVLLITFIVILLNLFVGLSYAFIDPRVRNTGYITK